MLNEPLTKTVPRNQAKELKALSDDLSHEAKTAGRHCAINNPPPQNSVIAELPFASTAFAKSNQFLHDGAGFYLEKLETDQTGYRQAIQEKYSEIPPLTREKQELLTELGAQCAELKLSSQERKSDIETEIPVVEKRVQNAEMELRELRYIPVFWNYFVGFGLICMILFGEVEINIPAFLFDGNISFLGAIGAAIASSCALVGAGIGIGYLIQNTQLTMRLRVALISLCGTSVLGMLGGIAYLRSKFSHGVSTAANALASYDSSLVYFFIGLALFFAVVIVKLTLFPSPKTKAANREYREKKNEVQKEKSHAAALKSERKELPNTLRNDISQVRSSKKKAIDGIDKRLAEEYKLLKKLQTGYNATLGAARAYYHQVDAIPVQAVSIFLEQLNAFRNDGVLLSTGTDFLSHLPDPFASYEMIADDQLDNLFHTGEFEDIEIDLSSIN